MLALLWLAALPQDYLPCTAGLSIEYNVESADGPYSITDTIKELVSRVCTYERVVRSASGRTEVELLARELVEDRITNAGEARMKLGFQPPLLVAPLERGKKWRFQVIDYEILSVGEPCEVPAGKLPDCVRVREKSRVSAYEATSVYARNVGLVLFESEERRIRATRIVLPKSKKTSKR